MCPVQTFAEGCGYSQGTVLSRQVDSTGTDDRPLLSVHHQNNSVKHKQIIQTSYIQLYTPLELFYPNNCWNVWACAMHMAMRIKLVYLLATAFSASRNSMYLSSSSKLHLLAKISRYCLFQRMSTKILYSSGNIHKITFNRHTESPHWWFPKISIVINYTIKALFHNSNTNFNFRIMRLYNIYINYMERWLAFLTGRYNKWNRNVSTHKQENKRKFTYAVRLEQLCEGLSFSSEFATKHSLQSSVSCLHLDQSWIWKSRESHGILLSEV